MENNYKNFGIKKLQELEKKGSQFNEIEKLKKEITEIGQTIKRHKSDSYEKNVFIIKELNLKEKLNHIIENS